MHWHTASTGGQMEPLRMVSGCDAEDLSDLPPAVVDTVTSARAPSTRHAYDLKWSLQTKSGVLPNGKTPRNAWLAMCFPSFKRAWSGVCLPPP